MSAPSSSGQSTRVGLQTGQLSECGGFFDFTTRRAVLMITARNVILSPSNPKYRQQKAGEVASNNDEQMSYDGLTIDRGKRHTKIVDEDGEVVFKTTNLKDARQYLELLEERDRYEQLLESRGIAPHRIYLLAADEEKRGRVNQEELPAHEVVIVAKTDDGGLVVRHLDSGKEEIVDAEEIEPIEGGSYLRASEVQDEILHVLVRFDPNHEDYPAHVRVFRDEEMAEEIGDYWWDEVEDLPPDEYEASNEHSDEEERSDRIYLAEIVVED